MGCSTSMIKDCKIWERSGQSQNWECLKRYAFEEGYTEVVWKYVEKDTTKKGFSEVKGRKGWEILRTRLQDRME